MKIFVDFDKTLTKTFLTRITECEPNLELIEIINNLKLAGHEITIYSCRSNREYCDEEDENLMKIWLEKHSVKYDRIEKNKPYFDILVDDKACNPFTDLETLKDLCDKAQ